MRRAINPAICGQMAFNRRTNARRVPEIVRAMENLKLALRMRFGDSSPDLAVTRRVAEIIDRAATEIERI